MPKDETIQFNHDWSKINVKCPNVIQLHSFSAWGSQLISPVCLIRSIFLARNKLILDGPKTK